MGLFEKCFDFKGKKYCWNHLTKKVNKIAVEELDVDECPAEVIVGLMSFIEPEKKDG